MKRTRNLSPCLPALMHTHPSRLCQSKNRSSSIAVEAPLLLDRPKSHGDLVLEFVLALHRLLLTRRGSAHRREHRILPFIDLDSERPESPTYRGTHSSGPTYWRAHSSGSKRESRAKCNWYPAFHLRKDLPSLKRNRLQHILEATIRLERYTTPMSTIVSDTEYP